MHTLQTELVSQTELIKNNLISKISIRILDNVLIHFHSSQIFFTKIPEADKKK